MDIAVISLVYNLNHLAQGYKTSFMLTSTEYEMSTALKTEILTNKEVSCFKCLRCCIYHAN